jgi:DNA-binding GntR family transcriptional regulator
MATKQDRAYRFLRGGITRGRFLPGQRILPNEIGKELGMSGVPVREALLRLQSERLVAIEPHLGAVVALISGREIVQDLTVLSVLEGYATRIALDRASPIVGELRKLNEDMRQALRCKAWDTVSHLNRAFHRKIYDLSDNEALVRAIGSLWLHLDSFMSATSFYLIPERAAGSIEEHERIVEMLADPATDSLELELFAREHGLRTVRSLERAPRIAVPL